MAFWRSQQFWFSCGAILLTVGVCSLWQPDLLVISPTTGQQRNTSADKRDAADSALADASEPVRTTPRSGKSEGISTHASSSFPSVDVLEVRALSTEIAPAKPALGLSEFSIRDRSSIAEAAQTERVHQHTWASNAVASSSTLSATGGDVVNESTTSVSPTETNFPMPIIRSARQRTARVEFDGNPPVRDEQSTSPQPEIQQTGFTPASESLRTTGGSTGIESDLSRTRESANPTPPRRAAVWLLGTIESWDSQNE